MQTIFDSWHLTFYNLVFTALPAMFFAVLDRDVKKKAVRVFPELYECGLKVGDLHKAICVCLALVKLSSCATVDCVFFSYF